MKTITHSPRIFLVENLLTHAECDHLIKAGEDKGMDVALITPYGSNKLVPSSTRTNTAAWLTYGQVCCRCAPQYSEGFNCLLVLP